MGHDYRAIHYDRVFPEEEWVQADGSGLVRFCLTHCCNVLNSAHQQGQEGDFHTDHIRVSGPSRLSSPRTSAESRRRDHL